MADLQSCYTPLDKNSNSIRLLILQPQPHPLDNRIQCRLSIKKLDSSLQYEALSYTWGPPDSDNFKIWVNGVLVPLRRNLLCALRAIRGHEDRVLWIDALCINQDDIAERGHQVGMMGPIYKTATQVLVWLGTLDEREKRHPMLDVISFYHQDLEIPAFNFLKESFRMFQDPAYDRRKWLEKFADSTDEVFSPYDEHWAQFLQLSLVDYWNRMWIIQEIYLAARIMVIYGSASIEWPIYSHIFSLVNDVPPNELEEDGRWLHLLSLVKRCLPSKLAARLKQKGPVELWKLIEPSEECLCQDRRDKIYGLFGLAADLKKGDIPVDYSMSLFRLYESVIRFQMRRRSGSENIFVFSQLLQRTLLLSDKTGYGLPIEHHPVISSLSSFKGDISIPMTQLGSITTEETLLSQPEESVKFLNYQKSGQNSSSNSPEPPLSRSSSRIAKYWNHYIKGIRNNNNATLAGFTESSGRRGDLKVFVTKDWYIGLGPTCVQDGDVLCRLGLEEHWVLGDQVLYAIIRMISSSDTNEHSQWRLIGRALLNGDRLLHNPHHSKKLQWPLPHFLDPPNIHVRGLSMDITANMGMLQVLTCPILPIPIKITAAKMAAPGLRKQPRLPDKQTATSSVKRRKISPTQKIGMIP